MAFTGLLGALVLGVGCLVAIAAVAVVAYFIINQREK